MLTLGKKPALEGLQALKRPPQLSPVFLFHIPLKRSSSITIAMLPQRQLKTLFRTLQACIELVPNEVYIFNIQFCILHLCFADNGNKTAKMQKLIRNTQLIFLNISNSQEDLCPKILELAIWILFFFPIKFCYKHHICSISNWCVLFYSLNLCHFGLAPDPSCYWTLIQLLTTCGHMF